MTKKQLPVTLGNIDKLLNKRLDQRFGQFDKNLNVRLDQRFEQVDKNSNMRLGQRFDQFEKHFDEKINETKEELRAEFKHLPTKEQYYAREDKTMGELKRIREELETTNDLYEKSSKRVDIIDQHLGIDTSVVF